MKAGEFILSFVVLIVLFLGIPFLLWLLGSTAEMSQTIERVLP